MLALRLVCRRRGWQLPELTLTIIQEHLPDAILPRLRELLAAERARAAAAAAPATGVPRPCRLFAGSARTRRGVDAAFEWLARVVMPPSGHGLAYPGGGEEEEEEAEEGEGERRQLLGSRVCDIVERWALKFA